MTMKKYSVLVVDDEEPARDLLINYVGKIDELELIGAVGSALEAKRLIQSQSIDILLTDIQMEDLTGIDLVKTLKNPPITIFTTSYSEYALEGYALDVIDYLVKPISFQRFCKAIDKAFELIQFAQATPNGPEQATTHQALKTQPSDYFFVKTNRKMVKVKYEEILFIQSYGEYIKLYTTDDVLLALQTTSYMETLLPPSDFIRIHRSYIVNLNQIKEIIGNQVVLDQHTLTVSKRMRDGFMEAIRNKGVI